MDTRYDRLRAEGASPFDAMRDTVALFARPPHARPGGPARQRPILQQAASRSPRAPAGAGQPPAAGQSPGPEPAAGPPATTRQARAKTAAQLAAESFPRPADGTVRAAANPSLTAPPVRVLSTPATRRPSRPL